FYDVAIAQINVDESLPITSKRSETATVRQIAKVLPTIGAVKYCTLSRMFDCHTDEAASAPTIFFAREESRTVSVATTPGIRALVGQSAMSDTSSPKATLQSSGVIPAWASACFCPAARPAAALPSI